MGICRRVGHDRDVAQRQPVDIGAWRRWLGKAVGLDWGIYFSQGEWFDAEMVADSRSNFTRRGFLRKMKAQRLEACAGTRTRAPHQLACRSTPHVCLPVASRPDRCS